MTAERRFASPNDLARMGRDWAWHAIKCNTEPTTTGNIAHDRACAEEFLRQTGNPPNWYEAERFGAIYEKNNPRPWQPK